jgi:DNA-binding IclR family transcriptional regulator
VPNAPAVGHALDVLELLARRATPIPASSIARELALPRSSTYHLLGLLAERGYVVHLAEERRYGLGTAAFELGSASVRRESLRWVSQTVLAKLVESTGQNGHFVVLHGRDVLYVIEERAPGQPSLITAVGVRLPAPLTASGLAILSVLPRRQVRALFPSRHALVRRHDVGPASLADLDRALVHARGNGFAYEHGFVTPGLASVASPVRDHNGHPVAAVALTFRAAEVNAAACRALGGHVIEAASQVAARISGGRPRRSSHGSDWPLDLGA